MIRGYGPLCRNIKDADESVYADIRSQRERGGNSDRCVALVSSTDGLCWWIDDIEIIEEALVAMRTWDGHQAQYKVDDIKRYAELWGDIAP